MAELNVQPKKNNSWWIWALLALVLLALLFFLLKGCNNKTATTGTTDSTATKTTDTSSKAMASTTDSNKVDFNSPKASYDEITDSTISVRGNNNYSIYGLGNDILFDTDKSTIKSGAQNQLKMISASLAKRFKGANITIYGNTDSKGTPELNKKLGAARADAVREWFVKNGGIPEQSITVHSLGENDPVASNATSEGRQLNRNVSIVATSVKSGGTK